MSLALRLPFRVPLAIGVKVTLTMQLAPGASVLGQALLLEAKSPGLLPVRVKLVMASVARGLVLVLVNVAFWAALVTPTLVDANVSAAGRKVTVALGTVPVPVIVRFWKPAVMLSVIFTVTLVTSRFTGANTEVMVQEAPAASVLGASGQLCVTVYSAASVPVVTIEVMLKVA